MFYKCYLIIVGGHSACLCALSYVGVTSAGQLDGPKRILDLCLGLICWFADVLIWCDVCGVVENALHCHHPSQIRTIFQFFKKVKPMPTLPHAGAHAPIHSHSRKRGLQGPQPAPPTVRQHQRMLGQCIDLGREPDLC